MRFLISLPRGSATGSTPMRTNYPPRSYILEAYAAGLASAFLLFVFGYWYGYGMHVLMSIVRFGL